jgi:hypothetical protein
VSMSLMSDVLRGLSSTPLEVDGTGIPSQSIVSLTGGSPWSPPSSHAGFDLVKSDWVHYWRGTL